MTTVNIAARWLQVYAYRYPFQLRFDLGKRPWRLGVIANPRRWCGLYLVWVYVQIEWYRIGESRFRIRRFSSC